jgi:hypothetical protein
MIGYGEVTRTYIIPEVSNISISVEYLSAMKYLRSSSSGFSDSYENVSSNIKYLLICAVVPSVTHIV